MKKMGIAVMAALVCSLVGVGFASAETIGFSWFNNINSDLAFHAEPTCTAWTEAVLGDKRMDIKEVTLGDHQRVSVYVQPVACSAIKLIAKCTFKDAADHKKTETKHVLVHPCQGGEIAIVADPLDWKTYTSFKIEFWCTPPCK